MFAGSRLHNGQADLGIAARYLQMREVLTHAPALLKNSWTGVDTSVALASKRKSRWIFRMSSSTACSNGRPVGNAERA